MKNKEISRFYQRLAESGRFGDELIKRFRLVRGDTGIKSFINSEIMPFVREEGLDFSVDDLLNYERIVANKLKEEDLKTVIGGAIPQFLTIAGITSLILIGGVLSKDLPTHAVLNEKMIIKSIEMLEKETKPESDKATTKLSESMAMIIDSTKEVQKTETNTDQMYIAESLNLLEPYVQRMCGITHNFRFLDGNKKSIAMVGNEGIPRWAYNRDKEEGSVTFMRMLFPSSAGRLNIESGLDSLHYLSKDANPSPEDIARIAACMYKIRNDGDGSLNKKISTLDTKKYKEFLKKEMNIVSAEGWADKKVETIMELLNSAQKMITEQEYTGNEYNSSEPERNLPKYTTERMLMNYFIEKFDKYEDVKAFYKEARDLIKTSKKEDISVVMQRLEELKTVLDMLRVSDYTPYKGSTVQNGTTYGIGKPVDGKVKFLLEKIFQDCADIAQRHMINLLCYSINKDWTAISGIPVEGDMDVELNEIIDAITEGKEIAFKPLKDRLRLFYWYQQKEGVDTGDKIIRTLWNYVISNMDRNVENNMYAIKYVKSNYEFETGFLNSLKLIYNVAYALNPENENLKVAKEKIDEMEKVVGQSSQLKNKGKEAIESTLKLLNPNVSVELCELTEKNNDFYGKVKINISCKDEIITFTLKESEGHAFVEHLPLPKIGFDKEITNKFEKISDHNQSALLWLKRAYWNRFNDKKLDRFSRIFQDETVEDQEKNKYYERFQFLKWLFDIQGEENNEVRIEDEALRRSDLFGVEVDIKVLNSRDKPLKDSKDLKNFIFKYYTNKKFDGVDTEKCFNFIKNEDGTATVYPTYKMKDAEEITIPATLKINEKGETIKVSSICRFAFSGFDKLKSIKIETGDRFILEKSFFYGCKNLNSFKIIVKGELEIKDGVFEGCENPFSFEVTGEVKKLMIKEEAFVGSLIKSFNVISSVDCDLEIGGYAFNCCENLESFEIAGGVKKLTIKDDLFSRSSIKSFKLSINGCSELDIGANVFRECEKFESFEIAGEVKNLIIKDKAFCDSFVKFFKVRIANDGEMEIGKCVFINCNNLESFEIDGVKKLIIKDEAFVSSAIKFFKVRTANDGEMEIGECVFIDCNNLESFEIVDGVKKLAVKRAAFARSPIKSFKVRIANDGEMEIGEYVFRECEKFESFEIAGGVKNLIIKDEAFGFSAIKFFKVRIANDGEMEIGEDVFIDCNNLESFEIAGGVKNLIIKDGAFVSSAIQYFNVNIADDGEMEIGEDVFIDCNNLESFEIVDGVKNLIIKDGAFVSSAIQYFNVNIADDGEMKIGKRVIKLSEENNEITKLDENINFRVCKSDIKGCIKVQLFKD